MTPERRYAPNFLLELFTNPLDPGYSDAAEARARYGPRRPWSRRGLLVLRVVTLTAVGFLLAIAYREAVAAEPDRTSAHAGLVDEIKAAQTRTEEKTRRRPPQVRPPPASAPSESRQ